MFDSRSKHSILVILFIHSPLPHDMPVTIILHTSPSHEWYIIHLLQLIHTREMGQTQTVLSFSCGESTVLQLQRSEPFLASFYDCVTSIIIYRITT